MSNKIQYTELELATEIFECLDQLYSIQIEEGIKRLPEDLVKHAGVIGIAHTNASMLLNKLKRKEREK